MPVRQLWPGVMLAAAIGLASCNGGSKSQTTREAPLPGGNEKPPAPTWYSKFLGLDKKPDTTRSSAVPEREPYIQPFDPAPARQAAVNQSPLPIALTMQVPPSVTPGQDLTVRVIARNTGSTASVPFQVRQPVPETAQLIRTDPPASLQGSRLVWNLPSIPPGGTQEVTVVYRPAKAGFVSLRADANDRDASLGFAQANVEVYSAATTGIRSVPAQPPQLTLRVRGPAEARQGETVSFDVNLTNSGSAAVGQVTLAAELDPGLDHESGARRLEIPIPSMTSGETKSVQLPLMVRGSGQLRTVVSATTEGGSARQEAILDVQAARLEVSLTGPQRVMLNQPGTWTMRVVNPGITPADNVTLRIQLPPELSYRGGAQSGQMDRGQVVWPIGRLAAREERVVQMTAVGGRLLDRSTLVASVSANRTAEVRADLPIEILGTPVLKVSIRGTDEAVEVGGKLIYAVELRNTGSLPVRDITVATTFGNQLKPLFGAGPTIVKIEGQRVICGRVGEIAPGDALMFRIEAEGATAGDCRVTVEAQSSILPSPVIQDEATRVVGKR